jgi:hypothetical protein
MAISAVQARNIQEAVQFADVIGLPLDVFVTIQWSKASRGERVQVRLLRLFERLYQWLFRRGLTLVYVYVHEIGTLRKMHTHFIIHLPPPMRGEFESMIPGWLDSNPCKGFIEAKPVSDMEGLLGYLLKATDPKVAKDLGIVMSTWQGLVIGKRCGTSENIGRKARQLHRSVVVS